MEEQRFDGFQTLTLVGQILNSLRRNIKSDDEESVANVLSQINKITSPWQKDTAPPSPSSNVMYALNPETSAWAAINVPEEDVKIWQAFGYTPDYTKRWLNAGLTLTQAMKWASSYNLKKYDPVEIAKWEQHMNLIEPGEVTRWLDNSIPTERAIEWTSNGGGYYDGTNWLKVFPETNATKLYETYQTRMTISQVRPWVNKGILGEDIIAFIRKGYTPAAAKKALDAGITVETAVDRKKGAPIPGSSWKKIAAIVEGCPSVEKEFTENGNLVNCTLSNSKTDEDIHIQFRLSGQFVEAYIQRKLAPGERSYFYRRTHFDTLTKLLDYISSWTK